jgi:hypothetical protein
MDFIRNAFAPDKPKLADTIQTLEVETFIT